MAAPFRVSLALATSAGSLFASRYLTPPTVASSVASPPSRPPIQTVMLVITWFSDVTFAASTAAGAAVAGIALATVRAAAVMDTARNALVVLGRMVCLHLLPAFSRDAVLP